MTERSLALSHCSAFLHTDLYGILLTEKRNIQQTFLLVGIHILDKNVVVALFLADRCTTCRSPKPLAVFLYIEVISV